MKSILKKSVTTKRVVFRATIELNSDYRERFNSNSDYNDNSNRLKPNGKYKLGNKEEKVSYEELKEVLTETLETKLSLEVNELLDTPILAVKINNVNEGSIEIIFTVLLNAYQFIASLSDFFDSVELIKDTAKKLLTRKLNKNYGYFFDVYVDNISPSRNRNYFEKECGRILPVSYRDNNKRDVFFYYLLFSNIVLTAIITFLVWKAVVTTYGW